MFIAKKKRLLFKIVVAFPLVLFADYLVMAVLGCISCLLGFGDAYFCGTYCLLGKGILLASALLYACYLFPDIRQFAP